MDKPLMPKATAVWLIDHTAVTFAQIAQFCGLHELEVQGLADEEVNPGMQGIDPVANSVLTWEEIHRCEADPAASLAMIRNNEPEPEQRVRGPRYTPIAKRADKPDGIAWLLRNHPEITDAQISKLIGTTKPTVQAVRDRTHPNSANFLPRNPVLLGLCNQSELEDVLQKARAKRAATEAAESAAVPPPD